MSNEHGSVQQEVRLVVREELEMKTKAAAVSEIVYTRPILVSNFAKYVTELHTDVNRPFKDLFQVSMYVQEPYIFLYMICVLTTVHVSR